MRRKKIVSDIKWIKITTDMFEDEKIRLIDAMPERDTIHYIWIRLLVQAGKTNCNGFIFLSDNIPYTDEMLSTIFCRPLTSIRLALKTLKDFGMIEVDEENLIKITNWDKHQNVEGMEKVRIQNKTRAKRFREKRKSLKEASEYEVQEKESELGREENECVQNSDNIESNVMQEKHNVTQNENNVIVTKQNKRESKNKNQNKNSIIDREKENNNTNSLSQEKQNINLQATELLKHYENITGMMGGLNLSAIKLAISKHGFDNIKMAVYKAFEVNKVDMTYINGILKNWKREGYPSDGEDHKSNNNKRGTGLNFDNFEAREYDYDSLEKRLLGWDEK
nr:phage replisome organizer N-terminal domain-containing protein [Clostridium botulinum]